MNFGSHIRFCPKLCLQSARSILSFDRSCETEVSYFKVEGGIEEHILWLQISMSQSLIVNIFETVEELSEIKSAYLLIELASRGHIVKQFTTCGKF